MTADGIHGRVPLEDRICDSNLVPQNFLRLAWKVVTRRNKEFEG